MTVDPEEGRCQIEAMKPEPLKVGDKVRLAAGQSVMVVVELEDYGNMAVCEWMPTEPLSISEHDDGYRDTPAGSNPSPQRETFPVSSLVRVEAS